MSLTLQTGSRTQQFDPRRKKTELDPKGWMSVRVTEKINETPNIVSFTLTPNGEQATYPHKGGQYLNVRVRMDGEEIRRKYTLSSASNGLHYRISVKREEYGLFSRHLHDQIRIGDDIDVHIPSGKFTLEAAAENTKPIVLLTAGIGITPAISMLHEIDRSPIYASRPVHFIHCARSKSHYPFLETVLQIREANRNIKLYTTYSNTSAVADPLSGDLTFDDSKPTLSEDRYGRLTTAHLQDWLPPNRDAEVYFIGPRDFMASVRRTLLNLGVPAAQLHWEFFSRGQPLEEMSCEPL